MVHQTRALIGIAAPLLTASMAFAATATGADLREMTTDRPDVTESPYTVNSRHVQLEMSLVDFTTDRADGVRTNAWQIAPLNIRVGVSDAVEVGIFVTPLVAIEERDVAGVRSRRRGIGDAMLRGKVNFAGNDGKGTGFGAIVDLKLPTAARNIGNGRTEGTVLFPIAFELAHGWDGGAMTGVEYAYTEDGEYRPIWINTVTFGHEIAPGVDGYVELTSAAGDGPHVATFDCGVAHKLNDHLQVDAGLNFGVTRAAPDLEVFAGISYRW